MAFVALTSLISTIQLQFLQSTSRVSFLHHAPIKSFYDTLSSLQAFLQKESSGDDDGGALRDLEIRIRDFALKTEDDIETQLSNIFLNQDRVICPENKMKILGQQIDYVCFRVTHDDKLHQTLREAAKNATELLKILATQKEPCLSVREMASVALTTLITKFEYYFLQPIPMVSLDDEVAMISFFRKLSSLQTYLLWIKSNRSDVKKYLGTKIRDFARKAEDDIGIQINNFFVAKDTEHEEGASQELRQTMQEAAENAAELLKTINKEEEHKRDGRMASDTLFELKLNIDANFREFTPKVFFKDKAPIQSFCNNLRYLNNFLWEESGGDDGALSDLEIQIRAFALKAKDDIEIQLSNILLAQDTEYQEIVSHELHQTLREATKSATELLKIIARQKESCVSVRKMAEVALSILITKFEYYFLQPFPKVSLGDEAAIISFLEKFYSLQSCLLEGQEWKYYDAIEILETQIRNFALKAEDDIEIDAIKILETQITNFALKAEDDIEIQVSNFILAKDTEHEGASQELRQTLQEAAEIAAELLTSLMATIEHEREREMTCAALTSLMETIEKSLIQKAGNKYNFLRKISSLQVFLRKESSGGGATIKDLKATIKDFALQLSNFFQARETKSQDKAFRELPYQALQAATENATELLKIITIEKEYAREMTSDALNIFMENFYYVFLHRTSIVLLDDKSAVISFFEKLSSLQHYLWRKESSGGAALNDFEAEIRSFVLKAKDDIETQTKYVIQAKHRIEYAIQAKDDSEYREEASQLNRTLQEAAERAEKLLMIINSENNVCDEKTEKACVALSSLMETIEKEFLEDEAVMKSFLEDISSLRTFLKKESSGGAAVKELETKIKDFALKAEDDINFRRTNDTEYEEKVFQELYQTTREPAGGAAELLKIINNRNYEVDEANESEPSNSWLKHASKSANVESDRSSQLFLKLKDRMVGRHHDCRVIKDQLLSSYSEKPKIISIVGMAGMGKTILAKNVYEDPSIASHFNARGWITIPQDYNKSRILSDLLLSIMAAEPNAIAKGITLDELKEKVRICLLGKRYLIVLDNIHHDWISDFIMPCFPDVINGSCILQTTRHLKRWYNYDYYVHNMTLLDPKQSWDLFCNILPIKEHMAPEFEKIKNHVVEKCDGLPQLIVEVAKRLSKCNNIQEGWKKIEKELESLGLLDRNALALSYNPLPHHLKVCFLYFGVFPKRKKIRVKMLIRLWIAEGFVEASEHKELENQAYEYLQELIDRSLLLIENRSSDGNIKTCRMHSAMHSFCVGESQKEGILCAVNIQQHSGLSLDAFANSCRWLSLCSHSFDYYVLFGTNIPRSIFFFHESPKMFVPLKLLRVLAFDTSISLQRLPVQLGDFFFLRYISITKWFEDMDYVVSNNLNLQALVVSSNGAPTVQLPSSIWKPPHLKHLELGNSYIVDPPSVIKENLASLSCVMRSIHCRKEVFSKFPNIKNLKIFLEDDIETSHIVGSCRNPIILDRFDYLNGVEKLSISVSVGCNAALPKNCMYPFGLRKLKLRGINISERDLNLISLLPELMVLKLENGFHGTVWNAVAEGGLYLQLRFLLLEAKELKQWVVSGVHFPRLRHLVLRSCNCLERIPKSFEEISFLTTIELEGCHASLVASAKQLQRKGRSKDLEIKILDPKYDESESTNAEDWTNWAIDSSKRQIRELLNHWY